MTEYRRIHGKIFRPVSQFPKLAGLPAEAAWVQETPDYTLGGRPIRSVYDAELRRLPDWNARYSSAAAGIV